MNEFLIMIHDDLINRPLLSLEETQVSTELFRDWIGTISARDKFVPLPKIWDLESCVIKQNEEVPTELSVEIKQSIGGLFLIKAKDYNEAITIAKGCPTLRYGAIIEVRMAIV